MDFVLNIINVRFLCVAVIYFSMYFIMKNSWMLNTYVCLLGFYVKILVGCATCFCELKVYFLLLIISILLILRIFHTTHFDYIHNTLLPPTPPRSYHLFPTLLHFDRMDNLTANILVLCLSLSLCAFFCDIP